MTRGSSATRRYLEAFFEADQEACDAIVRDDLGPDVVAAVDRLVDVTGSVIRSAAGAIGRDTADLLGTLFAQARRERPAAALVQDRVTAGALGAGAAATPADGDDAHAPAVLLAELAALLAIVTQGVAVVTGVPLASVLDDLWIALQPGS